MWSERLQEHLTSSSPSKIESFFSVASDDQRRDTGAEYDAPAEGIPFLKVGHGIVADNEVAAAFAALQLIQCLGAVRGPSHLMAEFLEDRGGRVADLRMIVHQRMRRLGASRRAFLGSATGSVAARRSPAVTCSSPRAAMAPLPSSLSIRKAWRLLGEPIDHAQAETATFFLLLGGEEARLEHLFEHVPATIPGAGVRNRQAHKVAQRRKSECVAEFQ